MKLEFIAIDKLCVSKANMRHARKAPDVADILPTIRARGVIQPLLVRPTGAAGHYEIVAGARRFHAAMIVAEERGIDVPAPEHDEPHNHEPGHPETGNENGAENDVRFLPCAILDEGDDAAAVEASLIENIARLDPDEVSRWECFTRLIREGRKAQDIAATFGLPDIVVRRTLALGNLLPRIRGLYQRGDIDAATVRHLTLASKAQQKAWLALLDDENARAPTGHQIKAWLFNGQSIPTRHALFDVAASGLAVASDLFGEDSYFVEPQAFWSLQNAAIEERRHGALNEGWTNVVVVGIDDHFHSWEYEKVAKRKGGHVYLDVRANGEVIVHEGCLSRRDAAKLARLAAGEDGSNPGAVSPVVRPELTSLTQTYIHLHRHAALRAALLGHPGVALRLMVAHAIVGSPLWRVSCEAQAAKSDAVCESVEASRAEAVFDTHRRSVLALLDREADQPTVAAGSGSDQQLPALMTRLLALPDPTVLDILAVVMGETLAAGSAVVETVGREIGIAMSDWWQADEAFFDTLRDREVLLAMLAEVAGGEVAAANGGEKTKVIKAIIADHLHGRGGREKCEPWVPRWMTFPPAAYTARGGVETVHAHARAFAPLASGASDPNPNGYAEDFADDEAEGNAKAPEDDGRDGARLAA